MREIERIEDQMKREAEGETWHGPSLQEALTGITAEQAAAKPLTSAHSIWEIVLHTTGWMRAVRRRIEDGWVDLPDEGDWPPVTDTSEAAWQRALAALGEAHEALRRTVAALNDAQLDDHLGRERDPPTGGGVSVYVTLHGIIQHNIYHAGQIALLKKAFD